MTTCTTFWRTCRRFASSVLSSRLRMSGVQKRETRHTRRLAWVFSHARKGYATFKRRGPSAGLTAFARATAVRRSFTRGRKACATLTGLAFGVLVAAQDGWPTYHGDYSGQRHSRLTQITPANVHQLTLAWAFQTGQTQQIKSTPILVNGILFLSTPDYMWAIDARSARQLWQYKYRDNTGFHIGHRGVAVYKDFVY